MSTLIRYLFILLLICSFMSPINAFSLEMRKETLPIIEMLQAGKAKISPDKKSIIDENGHIVGKETENVNPPPPKPRTTPYESAKDSSSTPSPQFIFCSKKCAIITKHCYKDESENTICINECDKESLICE